MFVRSRKPPLHMHIDGPVAYGAYAGELRVHGWAFSTVAPVARVEALLDGRLLGTLDHGSARPDVAEHFPFPHAAFSGFDGTIGLTAASAGLHKLIVRVTDAAGHSHEAVQPIVVPARPLAWLIPLHIDEPPPGATTAGELPVRGWAFSSNAPIVSIQATLDGRPLGPIPYGLPRPDVGARYAHPNAARCGFLGTVRFDPTEIGPKVLLVRATDALDQSVEASVTIRSAAPDEPVVQIDRASWRGDLLQAEGWALWPGSVSPRIARLFVDGSFVGEGRVDLSRPDILRRFPTQALARRCGFRVDGTLPPGDEAAQGWRELAVELVDGRGERLQAHVRIKHEAGVAGVRGDFASLLAEFRRRLARDPAVLDWGTALDLARAFPGETVFAPPVVPVVLPGPTLPYLDRTIDIVALPDRGGAAPLAEARRVAAAVVARIGAGGVEAEWLPGVGDEGAARASIIIPVHNNLHLTEACLARVLETLPPDFAGEIIVVDDASTDDTPAALARWAERERRIRPLRNDPNLGFLRSCNRAAAAATGDVLVFLNNDTLPRPGWLPPLLRTLHDRPDAGAVGGKLLYPDGTLQEAGGVIFADGSGCNFGRHDPAPDAPLYDHLREVDYCSGALLATPRALFAAIGGFDERFVPAYYEDTDYCFSVRERGLRVYYQPESAVVHLEGASSGTDLSAGVKRYQVVNRERFVAKWRAALEHQPPPPPNLEPGILYALAVRGASWEAPGGGAT